MTATRSPVIRKPAADGRTRPRHADDDSVDRTFAWDAVRRELGVVEGGFMNLGHLAVDRHLATPVCDRAAFRFVGRNLEQRNLTYLELARRTNRFANVLRACGVGRGDLVAVCAGRIPELYVAVLGALKNGSVVAPLLPALGPETIRTRLDFAGAKALVTTEALWRRKLEGIAAGLPRLAHVLVTGENQTRTKVPATDDLATLMDRAADTFDAVRTTEDDVALVHFTSGTTGTPKGVLHVHGAAVAHYATGSDALGLRGRDVVWCTADAAWVTGTSYGILAPLLHGATSVIDEAGFEPERWYRLLAERRVSVWHTVPAAIRKLMNAGVGLARRHRFPALRFVASVGEPLDAETVWWGQEALRLPIHDAWGQTETGGIAIANTPARDIRPGSMGRPLPGVDAVVVERGAGGSCRVVDAPGVAGELALRTGWPSMFRGYLHEDARYRACFAGDLYLTGDLVKRDADGSFWFVGRADDAITVAGHRIGTFEIECALLDHPAVAEAAAIGKPDPVDGETVKAFVSLRAGCAPGDALARELLGRARARLGAAAPKEIAFLPSLPRTRSGTIVRRLLRAHEAGLPEGDTSTLESTTEGDESGAHAKAKLYRLTRGARGPRNAL